MKTVLTTDPCYAASFLKSGGLVAFPTETVYGLGASIFDEAALEKIFEAKMRPADNPLIVHVAEISDIDRLAAVVPKCASMFIDAFFPGPLTLVLQKRPGISPTASAGLDTIGVRMPRHRDALEFLRHCGVPVAAPSANLSGRPSPTTWQAVVEDLDGRIDCILQDTATEVGLESTVVDCTSKQPQLLRAGAISLEQLRNVVPETQLRAAANDAAEPAKSPGLRHRHYSPLARVIVARGDLADLDPSAAYIGLSKPHDAFAFEKMCDSAETYANALFEFFRECDRRGIDKIYCEEISEEGIGAAVMDRVRRAAESRR